MRCVLGAVLLLLSSTAQAASFAQSVVSYDPGSAPATHWPDNTPYTNPAAALGAPEGVTEGFSGPNILSVFNPAVALNEIISIGHGGHLTLQLANKLIVGSGPSLGIFSTAAVSEADWQNPCGTAGNPVTIFGGSVVNVDVSADGSQWVLLGSLNTNAPTNYYSDASSPYLASGEGLTPADFSKPFTAPLSDLAGKNWPQILAVLDGSAGGTWLDLSSTGLVDVSYVRFSMPNDGNSLSPLYFNLDAVSIAAGHIGAPVPEPGVLLLLVFSGVMGLRPRRRG
jgi:hypothetical protein